MIRVAVAGKFDLLHEGHFDHILKAYRLGDFLYIITHPDDIICEVKGECQTPLYFRLLNLYGILAMLGGRGCVVVSVDRDGSSAKTLEMIKPNIFAKGGDRTPGNMPANEIESCGKIGCEIRYGIGDKLNSSSKLGVNHRA